MSKKKIIIIAVVVVAIGVAAYFGFGYIVSEIATMG